MMEYDWKVFQRPGCAPDAQLYSWQTGGIAMFFYTNYGDPSEMTVPFVGGFEITKLWDVNRGAAEAASRVFFGKPTVCDSFDQVSDDVDLVFVADCNFDGADHLELATPGLEKGVPTFVDKPFANTVANARAILELASKYDAPVFSLSILRAEPAVARFRNRLPEVGDVNFATMQGYGTHPAGLVHTISATQHLFGPGIETVRVLGGDKHTSYHLEYGDREDRPPFGVMINCDVGTRPFTALSMGVYGTRDDIHTLMLGDYIYPNGTAKIIKIIARMVRTRQVPTLMDEVIESIAVIEAFKEAKETGRCVKVADYLSCE